LNQVQYSQLNYRESPLGAINEESNKTDWPREKEKREENLKRKHQRLQHLKGLATMNGKLRDLSHTEEFEVEMKQNQTSMPNKADSNPSTSMSINDKEHFNLIK
jgi:hypothetical protein